MEKQAKKMPAAKAVALFALLFLVALGALFMLGLIETQTLLGKETYGLSSVIDEIKLIAKDVGGYFKGLWESIQLRIKTIEKGDGIADFCLYILIRIFPLVAILCYFMVALHLVFCWLPLVSVSSNGWSRVAVRMGKKLKKVVGWVIGFLVYAFVVYGSTMIELAALGKIALYVIAAYAVLRVILDGMGKKANVVNIVFTTISAAAIAVFAVIAFNHFLSLEYSLAQMIFGCAENAVLSMQGEGKNTDAMIAFIMMTGCWLCVFISLQRVVKAMQKQTTMNKGGVRKSLIWLLIWTVAAAVLSFFACKKIVGELSFGDWKDDNEFLVKAAIYGIVGLGLAIVTPILNCIGKSGSKKDKDEYEEDE